MSDDRQATIIKIAVICAAMPRWIGALLIGEGVPLPAEWLSWWVVFAAVMAAAMAVIEGWAFAYCFKAWRTMTGRASNVMAVLISLSAIAFIVVLSPYLASNVSNVPMASILSDAGLTAWSISVAASTILIVASVGYAQKMPREKRISPQTATHNATNAKQEESIVPTDANQSIASVIASAPDAIPNAEVKTHVCRICAEGFGNSGKLAAHMRWQHANGNGHDARENAEETVSIGG